MGGGGGGECEGRMEGRWEVKEDGGRWEGEGIGDDGYGRRLLVFFWTPPFIILCCFTIMSANDVTKSSDLGGRVIITNVPVLIIDMSLSHH